MNPKSLKGLKDLTSQLIDKPKLIDKLDGLRIRYAEITIELEKPDIYKDRRLSDKLHKEQAKLEKNETEQSRSLILEVESTGAILEMDAATSHLECFCSRICPSGGIQMRPDYIILDKSQEASEGIKAKVLLPGILDPSLRVHQSESFWRSEKNARKDAAFQAYVALYKAGLVDDNLMPLKFPEPLKYMEKKYTETNHLSRPADLSDWYEKSRKWPT